ncbi:MAG TPA: S8 family peptidase [Actinomycetota bacterium]
MKRSVVSTVVSVLLLSGALFAAPGSAGTAGSNQARGFFVPPEIGQAVKRTPGNLGGPSDLFVEGELVVQFKKGVKRPAAMQIHAAHGGARVLNRVTGLGGRIEHVKLPAGVSVAKAARRYQKDPGVVVAEPNFKYQWLSHITPPVDDPDIPHLWGLGNTGQAHNISDPPPTTASGTSGADIAANAAWVTEDGDNTDPIVAVVDSGVRITHDDLDNNLWVNGGETPANLVDDDGNGYVDDVHGCSFTPALCSNLSDDASGAGHGTHVAGTIAAEGENAQGIIGVCPHCRIMVTKFDLTTAGEVAAYAYARKNGARVINGSFGGAVWSKVSYNAIKQLNQAGIVAVFAAGNDSLDNDTAAGNPVTGGISPAFPASYNLPNIIAVAASNHHDEYGYFTGCNAPSPGDGFSKAECSFSNVGRESVDLAAPGVDIRSSVKTGDTAYDEFNGTSMASPHVAGAAALVRSEFPGLSPVQVKNKIMNGADKNLASLATFYSYILRGGRASGKFTRTSGRLDAAGALAAGTGNATPKTDGDIPGAKRIAGSKKGRVAYPLDVNDLYKRRLQKGKRYRVTLRVGKSDFDLWVWKPGTKQIWQFEPACFSGGRKCPVVRASFKGKGKNEVVTFKATKGGRYFFHVTAWLKFKGPYKLIIKQL